ncbi:MAG: hypothetical protein NUV46_04220 [Nanoarchaeota archaeon]|nr:hypothetical protein [Nanoarchaeota archaeon]
MEIKKILEKENPLFLRKEIHFEVKSNSVPSHEEMKNGLSEKFSFNPELIRIQKISGKFGSRSFDVFVDVYSSKKEFDLVVKKTKQEKEKEKKVLLEKLALEAEARKAAKEKKKAESGSEEKTEEN